MENVRISETGTKNHFITWPFVCLFITAMFENLSYISIRTVITPYAKDSLMMAGSLLGILSGALAIASLFSRPFSGKALDKWPHRRILILSLVTEIGILFSYMLVKSFLPLLIVRILHGFVYGIANTTVLTMAGNALAPSYMGKGLGIFGISQMIGLGIAPSLSMAIYNSYGADFVFAFTGLCEAGSLLFTIINPSGRRSSDPSAGKGSDLSGGGKSDPSAGSGPDQKAGRGSFQRAQAALVKQQLSFASFLLPSALFPSVMNFFFQFSYASVSTFIIVYGQQKGWEQVGLFYTVYALGSFVVRPWMGKMYDRGRMTTAILITTISFAAGIFILAETSSFLVFLFSAVLMTIGFGGGWCVCQADALNCKDEHDRGRASATYFMLNDLGIFLGSSIAGNVADQVGYSQTFLLFIIPLAIALLVYFLFLLLEARHQTIRYDSRHSR